MMRLIDGISGFVGGVGTVLFGSLLWAAVGGVCHAVGESLFGGLLADQTAEAFSNTRIVVMTLAGAMAFGLPFAWLVEGPLRHRLASFSLLRPKE